ncbi:MAG: hypothetical protein MRZ89_03380 [Lachnospiraceae bacterium]|nr:hypothetical protein [Lachnospiraceae bacterium]
MTKKEKIKVTQLLAQQITGENTVKDSIDLLKILRKRKTEVYLDDHDIETLVLCNSAMLSVVVDVLEELAKNE